jgi:hypothetical protein
MLASSPACMVNHIAPRRGKTFFESERSVCALGAESVGREGFVPYFTTLTLIAGLLAVWAICAI